MRGRTRASASRWQGSDGKLPNLNRCNSAWADHRAARSCSLCGCGLGMRPRSAIFVPGPVHSRPGACIRQCNQIWRSRPFQHPRSAARKTIECRHRRTGARYLFELCRRPDALRPHHFAAPLHDQQQQKSDLIRRCQPPSNASLIPYRSSPTSANDAHPGLRWHAGAPRRATGRPFAPPRPGTLCSAGKQEDFLVVKHPGGGSITPGRRGQ